MHILHTSQLIALCLILHLTFTQGAVTVKPFTCGRIVGYCKDPCAITSNRCLDKCYSNMEIDPACKLPARPPNKESDECLRNWWRCRKPCDTMHNRCVACCDNLASSPCSIRYSKECCNKKFRRCDKKPKPNLFHPPSKA